MKCQNMTMESEPQNHPWSEVRSVLWLLAGAQRVNQVMKGLMGTAIIYFIYISPYFCGRRIILVIADLTCDLHFRPATKPLIPFK